MYPYQDSTRPIEERIDDLLARMTTEEKIMQTDLYSNSDFCTVPVLQQRFLHGGQKRPRDRDRL